MMAGLTPERLQELRRIAEAATPGPWEITEGTSGEQTASNMQYISTFDPPTALALLDEIERLRQEREVMAEVLKAVHERDMHVHTCDHCECATCPEGSRLSHKAYIAQWIYSKGSIGE